MAGERFYALYAKGQFAFFVLTILECLLRSVSSRRANIANVSLSVTSIYMLYANGGIIVKYRKNGRDDSALVLSALKNFVRLRMFVRTIENRLRFQFCFEKIRQFPNTVCTLNFPDYFFDGGSGQCFRLFCFGGFFSPPSELTDFRGILSVVLLYIFFFSKISRCGISYAGSPIAFQTEYYVSHFSV